MKAVKILVAFLFLFSTVLGITSCSSAQNPDNTFISISQKVIDFSEIGDRAAITAQIFPANEESEIVWSSSNPDIAKYENGEVVAIGYGSCVIRASYKDISAACTVNIENPDSALLLSSNLFEFNSIGAVSNIVARTGKKDITALVTWTTTNPDIATCNQNGVITTHGYGACTLIARLGSQTALTSIVVSDPDAKKLTLSMSSATLNSGENLALTAEKSDNAGSNVTWISSNPNIATCTDGVVTALNSGVCAIIAVTELGASDVCVLTVNSAPPAPEIPVELLGFTMPQIPYTIHTVNGETGEIIASAVITSYTIEPQLDKETGRLYMPIKLTCVKTFDSTGPNGVSPVALATNLYMENDKHCERRLYKTEAKRVGDEFTIECGLFSVQTSPESQRVFYFTFEDICEV